MKIIVFSDAGSYNNGYKNKEKPMFASIGCVITIDGEVVYEGKKLLDKKDSSYGELYGAIVALKVFRDKIVPQYNLKPPYDIELVSDNQFVTKGVNEWLDGWIKKGWKNYAGKTVAHVGLWKTFLHDYLDNPDFKNLKVTWTRGHEKDGSFFTEMNNRVDKLAVSVINAEKKARGL